jgi:hypothetical protein
MYWGAGSALGLLTILGYAVFVIGATLLWRSREDLSIWVHDEVGAFHGLREESRLKILPSCFLRSLRRMPRRRIHPGAILLLVGPLLLLLDFFI